MLIFSVDPDGSFDADLRAKFNAVDDMRIPLQLIQESWFKGNRAIFETRGGPGKFADLTARYKIEKEKQFGFVYPILLQTGILRIALTIPQSSKSRAQFIGKKSLLLGVDPDDVVFNSLQYGTKKMKPRPFILLGPEQTAPSELNNRTEAWKNILLSYVLQVTGAKDN